MSLDILKHLEKDNLHHAYLLEGRREEIIPALVQFNSGAELIQINLDTFKIEDARNLKSYSSEKGYADQKKIFIISANNFLLEAQNSLLKMFEEPIPATHFFVVVPDTHSLLPTFISRFYLISDAQGGMEQKIEAEKFLHLPLKLRIDFLKDLLEEPKEEDAEGNEIVILDSTRSKALKFLNALESILAANLSLNPAVFEHIFKVRKFLRMPGSSTKSLMESVALITPVF